MELDAAISIIQEAIKLEPAIVGVFRELFTKENPTAADFDTLRVKVANQSYKTLVPNSALP